MRAPPVAVIAGGAVLAAVVFVAWRGARQAGGDFGGAVVDFADGALSGAVVGIGERVGIPATNLTECERARAEGRTWDASFACPAGTFISYLWD